MKGLKKRVRQGVFGGLLYILKEKGPQESFGKEKCELEATKLWDRDTVRHSLV
jgi:hypothetical protein